MGLAVVRAMSARRCKMTRTELEATHAVVTDTRALTYLSRALRLRPGDEVEFFDGQGAKRKACLQALTKDQITGTWQESLNIQHRQIECAPIPILARLKSHAEDDAISALAALGFPKIRIFQAERDATNKPWNEKQTQRWRRIAEDSCRQSGGYWCTEIQERSSLNEAIKDLEQIVYGDSEGLNQTPKKAEGVGIVIGPEGGLSEGEKSTLKQAQALSIRLGKQTLRARHAAALLPTIVLHNWWSQT